MSDPLPAPMQQALLLAKQALYTASPNPRVGCVITDATGNILGQGCTQPPGQAHAEIMALRDARARGHNVRGATAWVTLEPCSHVGRTGPCCDALIAEGIGKVAASLQDPNPLVAGKGFARLRAAGVAVEVGAGAEQARTLNAGFFSRMQRQRPWVRLKAAASLDGRTALSNGTSQWITGQEARADGHAWRARACAILTGVGTVLHDDPLLDVRLAPVQRQPWLAVLDSHLRTPPEARLLAHRQRKVLIYTLAPQTEQQTTIHAARQKALEAQGAGIVTMPPAQGRVDVQAVLRDLAQREVNELHVEAGAVLNGALIAGHWVDEYLFYMAPMLIGAGHPMAELPLLKTLDDVMRVRFTYVKQLGEDLRIIARSHGNPDNGAPLSS